MSIKKKVDISVLMAMMKILKKKNVRAIAKNAIAMINHAKNAIVIAIVTIATAQNPITPAASSNNDKKVNYE